MAGNARHLLVGFLGFGRGVDPDDAAWPVLRREAGDHPGLRAPGHRADDDGIEEHAECALLLHNLLGPAREAEAPKPVVRGPGRDRVRLASGCLDVRNGALPALLEPDPE